MFSALFKKTETTKAQMMDGKRLYGVLAEYPSASAIYHACEMIRDAGYVRWDSHTPYPVHGIAKAMGSARSTLGGIVFVMGCLGASAGLLMQWWMSAVDYPLVISGKPLFSWQAFVPIIFELMVLFSAAGAVFGMFHLNRLPRYHHPLFSSERFRKVTDDGFFISIEGTDPKFNRTEVVSVLQKTGAVNIELVED